MNRPRFTPTIQWLLSAALVAACGGDSNPGSADTVAPTVTLITPAAFADVLGTLSLSATASDNVGVSSVEYQVDGRSVVSTSTGPNYAASVPTVDFASGQHVVRARARDVAGNVSAWSSATVRLGGNVALGQRFTKADAWATNITNATAFAQAPDGRFFVAEQAGTLRVVLADGTLLLTPFVSLVVDPNHAGTERGLLGVALHPNFTTTDPYVYLYYTTGVAPIHNRVSRFTANPSNPNIASANSEVFIVDALPTLIATNHNGGALHFGIDGKLYVGVGDNANSANAPSLATPLGKLLRFNDDGTIPNDNPFFVGRTGLAQAIWAYGLRNPFTFAVQPVTGRIHINDVGEGTWEEIILGAAGANYGWPASEGPTALLGIASPLFAYRHNLGQQAGVEPRGFFTGSAIAGGAFYPTAGTFPIELRGSYFFGDLGSRVIGVIDMANGNAAYTFANLVGQPVDLRVGLDGALYVLTRNAITRIGVGP